MKTQESHEQTFTTLSVIVFKMLKLDTTQQRQKKIMQSLIRQRSNLLCRKFSVSKAMGPFVSHQDKHKLNRAD